MVVVLTPGYLTQCRSNAGTPITRVAPDASAWGRRARSVLAGIGSAGSTEYKGSTRCRGRRRRFQCHRALKVQTRKRSRSLRLHRQVQQIMTVSEGNKHWTTSPHPSTYPSSPTLTMKRAIETRTPASPSFPRSSLARRRTCTRAQNQSPSHPPACQCQYQRPSSPHPSAQKTSCRSNTTSLLSLKTHPSSTSASQRPHPPYSPQGPRAANAYPP